MKSDEDMAVRPSHTAKLILVALSLAMMLCAGARDHAANTKSGQAESDARPYNPYLILFRRAALDTRAHSDLDTSSEDMAAARGAQIASRASSQKQLRIVQFHGAIKRDWIDQLKATGAEIVGYIANNAYIIRGGTSELARAAAIDAGELADDARPIQWMGRFQPMQKIDASLDEKMLSRRGATVEVEIELLESMESDAVVERIGGMAYSIVRAPRRFLNYRVISVALPVERLIDVASFEEVLFIAPFPEFRLHDERSAQIVAANLDQSGTGPAGPGYLAWLASKGLDSTPDFLLDFTDTGLDRGSTEVNLIHPDFRDAQGRGRVAYNITYHAGDPAEDRKGHGTIVAATACGLGADDRLDPAGYRYGLGVYPYAVLGASRIFNDSGRLPYQLRFTTVASAAYGRGARISNNSWGNGSNVYDAAAQEYDSLTRDAQPSAAGNQEMLFVFSAGNDGAGGKISSPGTAKNVITVAASESYRPEGQDSCNLDGEGGIGPEGANSAMDILRYSSGGPVSNGYAKPDLSAPGTHIYGAASQASLFNAGGLCPGTPIYQPPGQRFYTWSSGTSLAAPHVAGAAALIRKHFASRSIFSAPSPAMLKAYLINSATYLTGENAGGDLPAPRQGWGLVDVGRALNAASRKLIDQTHLFTQSGESFEIQGSLADRSKPLRVTLAWTDAPGSLAGAAIVNDLDLEVKVGEATVYRGNHFTGSFSSEGGEADRANNVESIFLPADLIPEGYKGNFTITVRAANIAGDGVPSNGNDFDQDFALVVYNIADPIPSAPDNTPVITSANYFKKTLSITGRNFTAGARVEINGKAISSSFTFDAITNTLSIRKKSRKLNLKSGDNEVVIIEGNDRSQAFTLRL